MTSALGYPATYSTRVQHAEGVKFRGQECGRHSPGTQVGPLVANLARAQYHALPQHVREHAEALVARWKAKVQRPAARNDVSDPEPGIDLDGRSAMKNIPFQIAERYVFLSLFSEHAEAQVERWKG